jgi:hypothetical protein
MEIDENLARAELSPAQEAAHIRRRQELWEQLHGSAKAIGARAANAVMGKGDATEKFAVAFTTDTATSTGRAASTIRQVALRGRELGSPPLHCGHQSPPRLRSANRSKSIQGSEPGARTNFALKRWLA